MSIKDSIPTDTNLLQSNSYKFVIARLPATVFFTQTVVTPAVGVRDINTPNPFIKLNYSSTEMDVGFLRVTFKVDENLQNYMELFNWMQGLSFPEDFTQYSDLKKSKDGIRSDATLLVITSSNNPNREFYFRDVFPINLSSLTFDVKNNDAQYVECTVTFSVRDFTVNMVD